MNTKTETSDKNPTLGTQKINEYDTYSLQRLQQSWELILDQFRQKAVHVAQEEGPGISIFRMLNRAKKGDINCEYYYAERDGPIWKMLFERSPQKDIINKIYNGDTMYLICVCVPTGDSDLNTTQNMRLFNFDTHEEILL